MTFPKRDHGGFRLPYEGEGSPDGLSIDNIGGEVASVKAFERLNQIDRVGTLGVGDYIALPQLVACGDQSVGKSSVLEGISGCPFPRQDGFCTRFPTEIVLRLTPPSTKEQPVSSHLHLVLLKNDSYLRPFATTLRALTSCLVLFRKPPL